MTNRSTCEVCHRTTDATICIDCADDIIDALDWIPRDLADLRAVETRQAAGPLALGDPRRQWRPRSGEASTLPAHLRSTHGPVALPNTPWVYAPGAADQIWVTHNALTVWAGHVAGIGVRNTDAGFRDAAAWLRAHISDVRRHPDAAQIHDELTYLHTDNDLYVLGSAARTEFYGPCDRPDIRVERLIFAGPRCAGFVACGHESCALIRGDDPILAPRVSVCGAQLEAAPGETTVTCQACGERYDTAGRKAKMRGRLPDSLGTFREVAGALTSVDAPVTVDLIQKAVQRGQIPERGRGVGGMLVRVGDVEAYLVKRDERAAKRRKITAA